MRLAEELDRSIDFLAWELRPAALDHLGLPAAMARLVGGWSERFHVRADYDTVGIEGFRLRSDVEANLYRLAQEALHNVYKHARATHVSVLLERRDHRIVLMVEDDGRGFAIDDVSLEAVPSLGLVSMRERAALVGGELTIESTPGFGTTITVRVPTADADATTMASVKKLRILIVDDHPLVRDGLKRLINDQPDMLVAGEAGDGHEALRFAKERLPDVALVDIWMPGLDGARVTQMITDACPQVKVIALTRHDDGGFVRQLLEAGATGYVLKQSALSELTRAVRAVAAGQQFVDASIRLRSPLPRQARRCRAGGRTRSGAVVTGADRSPLGRGRVHPSGNRHESIDRPAGSARDASGRDGEGRARHAHRCRAIRAGVRMAVSRMETCAPGRFSVPSVF